jgi:hypothetical protein
MKNRNILLVVALLIGSALGAAPAPSEAAQLQASTNNAEPASAAPVESEIAGRADKRYEEMLGKMQAAVEEIAQLYGNPTFLQVFTNDAERAAVLKARLRAARSEDDIRSELAEIQKKRDDLINDMALRERESARLAGRLVRQRAALDALAAAFEQARKAVEDTAK